MVLMYDVFVTRHSVKVVILGLLIEGADQQLAIIKGHPCIVLKNTGYSNFFLKKNYLIGIFLLFNFFLNLRL